MDEKTKQALLESIAKWEDKVKEDDPYNIGTGASDCPLCRMFHSDYNDGADCCTGCPVKEKTKRNFCIGTPQEEASYYKNLWRVAYLDYKSGLLHRIDAVNMHKATFRIHAQQEVDFLKSLLPKEEQNNEAI